MKQLAWSFLVIFQPIFAKIGVYTNDRLILQVLSHTHTHTPCIQVSYIISAIQAGAIGTQACNEAVNSIQSIVGDLETTAMFCSAGALNREPGNETSFSEHRMEILATAKKLVDNTKQLVSSAGEWMLLYSCSGHYYDDSFSLSSRWHSGDAC